MSETTNRIGVRGAWLTGPLLWAMAKARTAQWDRLARAPARVQTETLLRHCRAARSFTNLAYLSDSGAGIRSEDEEGDGVAGVAGVAGLAALFHLAYSDCDR